MGAEGYGGPESSGANASSLTLAQAYANGAAAADATLTLDATRGGLTITASALTGVTPITINHTLAPTAGTEKSLSIVGSFAPASGTAAYTPVSVAYTVNQTGGANGTVTGIKVNATETAVVGTHVLLDLQVASASKFSVLSSGRAFFAKTPATAPTAIGDPLVASATGFAHQVEIGNLTNSCGLRVGQSASNSLGFSWIFNATPGNAAAELNTFGYANQLSIDASLVRIQMISTNAINLGGTITISDAKDIAVGSTTGTKIGTATSQKLGFFNRTPVIQPATTGETVGFTTGAGTAVKDDSTFTGNVGATAYRLSDVVKHLKNLGLIAV